MANAISNINGIEAIYPDAGSITPNIQAGVTHFLNHIQTEQKAQQVTSIMSMFDKYKQMGTRASPWIDLGHNSPREFTNPNLTTPSSDIRQVDESFLADATAGLRQEGAYRVVDIGFVIKDDEMNISQFDITRSIARRFMQLKNRFEIQVVLDALRRIPVTDTMIPGTQRSAENGINSVVPPHVRWNPTTKVREYNTSDAYGWNMQKVSLAQRNLAQASCDPMGALVISSRMTTDAFNLDEQSVNGDYQNWSGGWQSNGIYSTAETARFGMHWIQLSEFPNQRNGNPGGICVNDAAKYDADGTIRAANFAAGTGRSASVSVADEYVLSTDSMKFLYSGEQPMFRTKVWYNEEQNMTKFRFTIRLGAMCVYPKGVIKVFNQPTA